MPRVKDIAWKFVIKLEGEKWRCPHCENEYSGKVTRVKSHFLRHRNKGISSCKKVPEHIRTLMDCLHNQVSNKDDIAWKFVNRLGDNQWRCHYCSKEFFGDLPGVKGHLLEEGPYGMIPICTEVPDHVRTLMRSLLDEVAEEESREAHGQSSMEPQSRDVPTQAEVTEEESREANSEFSMGPSSSPGSLEYIMEQLNFNQQDVIGLNSDQQSQAERQFHQSSTMPSSVQNSHGESISCSTMALAGVESYLLDSPYQPQRSNRSPYPEEMQMSDHQAPAGASSFLNDQLPAVGNSNCLQECNQHSQWQTPMDIDPSIASQHTSKSHIFEVTNVDLQVPKAATNTTGPSSSQDIEQGFSNQEHVERHCMSRVIEQERIPGNVRATPIGSPIRQMWRAQPIYNFHKQPASLRPKLQNVPEASYINPTNVVVYLNQSPGVPPVTLQSEDLMEQMLPQVMVVDIANLPLDGATSYSPSELLPSFTKSLALNAQQNPSAPLPSQNRQHLDNTFQNELRGSILLGPTASDTQLTTMAITDASQHSNQPHEQCGHGTGSSFQYDQTIVPHSNAPLLSCHEECGTETSSVPLRESMDIYPPTATNVNLHVLKGGANRASPSSSQDMNGGSPIMNIQSINANNEEIRNLKRKVEELDVKEAIIKEQMEIECDGSSVRKKPRILVEEWMKERERARNNFQIIGQANGETLPPKEQVETLTREVEELIERTLPQPLLIEARDAKGDAFLERKLMGEAIHRNIELIWNHLKENHVCKLGIYGMGGVGKTTIMMHIHNRLLKDATFDGVLFITVSQDFSIYKLQSDICKALKFGVMEDEHEKKRAAMLSEHLERKKNCVLILDDVWQHFKLQDVGIPDRAGLKVVLTTRFSKVCSRMDCEEIKIEPLGEVEAWKLFMEELGSGTLVNIGVEKVARKIAKRCAGLPLAINTMARSMRGEKNFCVWQDTLNKLERSHTEHTEMEDKVLSVLRLSYERLSGPRVKQCFLFCALFPKDESIKQMKLIEYFIDEGFLDEWDTREAQYYRGLAIVEMLRNASLLEVDRDYVRMHDLIREMALRITSTVYMVKAGWGLERRPDGEYWTKDLEKVSLMQGRIKDIPPDMSPNCPKLSTLLLNGSFWSGVQIQDSFFMNLRGLKVLNLSGRQIIELPDSVSELANLRALLLRNCRSLCRIPYLGKLKSLRKLDAHGCRSLLAIGGLDELRNLRYLDLSKTGIETLLEGTLRRPVNLQYLKIEGTVKAEDVIQLKALERLECNFGNVDDFNKYMRIIERSGCHDYSLIVDQEKSLWFVTAYVYSDPEILPENKIKDDGDAYFHHYTNCPKLVEIRSCNYDVVSAGEERNNDSILIPGDVDFFMGTNCRGMTNLSDVGLLRCLRELHITEWDNLTGVLFGGVGVDEEEVRNARDSPTCLFPSLERLVIQRCSKLKYLFGHESRFSLPLLRDVFLYESEGIEGMTTSVASPPQLGGLAFPRLERISVRKCGNMKRVVGSTWLPHFPNLTEIMVCSCEGIKEIISEGGENHGGSAPLNTPSSSLPSPFSPLKLKLLWLYRLPQLKSIWEGTLSFIPGAKVEVRGCPKLRSVPLDMLRKLQVASILQMHKNMSRTFQKIR